MTSEGQHNRHTKQLPHEHMESFDFDGRGDDRQRQYNHSNISSGQMAAKTADSVSDGGTIAAYSEPWTSASPLTFSDAGFSVAAYPVGRGGYEENYPIDHKAPSFDSIDTAGTGNTETTVRDSTDGCRLNSFVFVDVAEILPGPAPFPQLNAGRCRLTARNLQQHNTFLLENTSYNPDIGDWAVVARPKYARHMVQSSTKTKTKSIYSVRSAATSQSWILTPAPDQDASQDLVGIGTW